MRHLTGLLIALLLLGTLPAAGQAVVTAPTLMRGPYVQSVTATTALIVWATDTDGPARVCYAAGTDCNRTVMATTGLVNGHYQHVATLTGLRPATRYTYRIYTAGADLTPWPAATFTTATTRGDFTFLVLGDSRSGSPAARTLADRMATLPTDLILHTGDLATTGTQAQLDAEFFGVYRDLLGRVPVYPVPGNHDYATGRLQPYLDSFYLPGDPLVTSGSGPEEPALHKEEPALRKGGLAEHAYSFDWGNAHFVALDTNLNYAPGSPQYTWLARDLAGTRQLWKFVFLHHPPYSSGSHGSDLKVRRTLTPLFERYRVDIAFAGHDHLYERSVPLIEGKPDAHGVIYIVTGGGGAALYRAGRSDFTAYSRSVYHFIRVEVHGCTLTLQAIGRDGAAFDTLVLDKCEAVQHAGPQRPRSTWPAWPRAGQLQAE